MLRSTIASLRAHSRRLVAASVAIVIGVGFVAVTLVAVATMRQTFIEAIAGRVVADVVIEPGSRGDRGPDGLDADALARVRRQPGVAAADGQRSSPVDVAWPDGVRRDGVLRSVPAAAGLRVATLTDGRFPAAPGEVVLDASTAQEAGVRVGQVLRMRVASGVVDASVVGLATGAGSPLLAGEAVVLASDATVARWAGRSGYDEIGVLAAGDTSPERLVATLQRALPSGVEVRTAQAAAEAEADAATNALDVLRSVLLAFAAVALAVAGIVIANTFTIVLAQRTRELALLRCVGATRGQVLRSVLAESTALAVTASALGVAAGVALAALGREVVTQVWSDITVSPLQLDVVALLVPFAVGVLVTVAASVLPARRATRVAPLAAMRPPAAGAARRAGVVRLVLAALVELAGVGLLVLGARSHQLLLGIPGGFLSFLGVLLAGSVVVPAAVRLVGLPARRLGGVPARLAVDNAVRNPGRASATASALLVGVTLITLMSVGAASSQATFDRGIAEQFPLDVGVTMPGGEALPAGVVDAVAAAPGITATSRVHAAEVEVGGVDVKAVAPERPAVLHAREAAGGLADGTILVDPHDGALAGVAAQPTVTVRAGGRSVELRVVPATLPVPVVVSAATLERLAPAAPVTAVWAKTAPGADTGAVVAAAQRAAALAPGAVVDGSLPLSTLFSTVLSTMLLVVTALLGVAVLIAFVGIVNTLSLSVVERTRESALLRALGLTRRQLRATLGVEALLLALVGALLGVLLGIGYGVAGTSALLGGVVTVVVDVPWVRIALVVLVAAAAGVLASVLPARRAAKVAPAAALADE